MKKNFQLKLNISGTYSPTNERIVAPSNPGHPEKIDNDTVSRAIDLQILTLWR
jgi:hypothetical protein